MKDRAKLAAFQSGLTAAAGQLAAADKTYLAAVRGALRGGALAEADGALTRFDQQVALAVQAAPPSPDFGGCAAPAKAAVDKARKVLIQAAVGRRQRVEGVRKLGASRGLSIADYFSVAPPGAADIAPQLKRGLTEASGVITRCEHPPRPKPPRRGDGRL